MAHHEPHLDNGAHVVPIKTYAFTLFLLFILMATTLVCAFITFPGGTIVNNVIAMTIACIKAGLVISIFMGVWYGTKLTKLWAALGFVWFTMLFMIFADYASRSYEVSPSWDKGDHGSAMSRTNEEPVGGDGLSSARRSNSRLILASTRDLARYT